MDTEEKHIKQTVSILKAMQWEEIPFPSQRKIYNNQSWNEFIQLIIKEMKAVIGVKARATWDHVPKGKACAIRRAAEWPTHRSLLPCLYPTGSWEMLLKQAAADWKREQDSKLLGFETSLFLYSICTLHKHTSSLFLNIQKPDAHIMPRSLLPSPSLRDMLTGKLAMSY